MQRNLLKRGVYVFIILCLLVLSFVYKFYLVSADKKNATVKTPMDGKRVVNVWMKDSYDSETRRLQIDDFNENNKDNIYINFQTYDDDYYNILRISLATKKIPDIFEYGYNDLFINKSILSIEDLGINTNNINKSNFLYYNREPYGVRLTGNSVKFIWNKDIFKGAGLDPDIVPQTWGDVTEIASSIKKSYPDITPFEFPFITMADVKDTIGETSVNLGSIYTSFWNYKKGVYDFQYSKDILTIYNNMYRLSLINDEFDKHGKDDIRNDFYQKKCAMMISTYEDKCYFTNIMPLEFNIGISDLPKINKNDTSSYYFDENSNCIVINKDIQDKDAVKKVFEWLISDDMNKQLFSSGNSLPTILNSNIFPKDELYSNYSDIANFKYEIYDPTLYINHDINSTIQLFCKAIKGLEPVETVIDKLNKNYAAYKQTMIDKVSFNFNLYID